MAPRGETNVRSPPIPPISVDCTDTVGEAHVFHALAAGADGVAIVGCGGGCLHSGSDPKAELVGRLNRTTADLGLGERAEFFVPDPMETRLRPDRTGAERKRDRAKTRRKHRTTPPGARHL